MTRLSAVAVTTHDSKIPRGFGIRTHYMVAALSRRFDPFCVVGPLHHSRRVMMRGRLKHRYHESRGEIYRLSRDRRAVRAFGRQVDADLSGMHPDVVISPTSTGSSPLAYAAKTGVRVLWTDLTFHNYVTETSRSGAKLARSSLRDGFDNERRMLRSVDIACFASTWAATACREHYADCIDPNRIHVVPFGANLPDIPTANVVREMIASRPNGCCVITFIGFDWERKGGALVLAAAKILRSRGMQVEVNIVGVEPPVEVPEYVHVLGRLGQSGDKASPKISSVLASSHFLMVPSRAEAFGHVYAEAAAFGVPSIATAVGGVPTAVVDRETGFLLDLDADGADYADTVERAWASEQEYASLAVRARNHFNSRLDWDIGAATVESLCLSEIGE